MTTYTRNRTKQGYTFRPNMTSKRFSWSRYSGWAQETGSTYTTYASRWNETMQDMQPQGHGGKYPDRACHHTKTVTTIPLVYGCTVDSGGDGRTDQTDLYGSTSPPGHLSPCGSSPPGTMPDLLSEILENIDPAKVVFDAMPFLGEFRETVNMIKHPFEFLSGLPRGSRTTTLGRHLRRLGLGPASGAWLQYRYGWRPLMGDLTNIASALYGINEAYESYMSGIPTTRKSLTRVYATGLGESVSYSTWDRTFYTKTAKCVAHVRVLPARGTGAAMSYPNFVAAKAGLTLGNIASAAWELTPLSFVYDWFIPVGTYLQKLRSTDTHFEVTSAQYHDTWETRTVRCKKSNNTNSGHGYVTTPRGTDWTVSAETKTVEYWRGDTNHQPGPTYSGMSPMTTTKVISALALIAQRLMAPIQRS